MSAPADPTLAAERFVFDEEWYENAELRHLPRLLTGVSTFVDVGASVGPYTHCADGNMRDGRIIAVEANPDTFARLEAHCSNWRASSSNRLETVHAAASDRVGQLELFIPDSNQLPLLSAIFTTTGAPSEWRTVTVDCVTLDDLLADAKPDLIKVDVEGAEFRVLRGAHQILSDGRCRFLIEIHPWGDPDLGKTPADIFMLMYEYGYDFERVARHWHFRKVRRNGVVALKHRAILLVMRNGWLKRQLKTLVLAVDRLRQRSA